MEHLVRENVSVLKSLCKLSVTSHGVSFSKISYELALFCLIEVVIKDQVLVAAVSFPSPT